MIQHSVYTDRVSFVLERAGRIFRVGYSRQGRVVLRSLGCAEIIIEEHAVQPSLFGKLCGALVLLGDAQEVERLVPRIHLAVQDLLESVAVNLRRATSFTSGLEPINEQAEVIVGGLVVTPGFVIGNVVGSKYRYTESRYDCGSSLPDWKHVHGCVGVVAP